MSSQEGSSPASSVTAAPKIKYDWYQTETHVVVTVLLKNAPRDQVQATYGPHTLSMSSPIPGSSSEYSLELDLSHEINPSQCAHSVSASKVEIKMKKVQGLRWDTLEAIASRPTDDNIKPIPQSIVDASGPSINQTAAYPFRKDWNKIETELKKAEQDEKPEGEEALKKVFESIYSQGSDEVKKAMNKSFMESQGTVLSTNWNEIRTDQVKIQPPDGVEFKKWD